MAGASELPDEALRRGIARSRPNNSIRFTMEDENDGDDGEVGGYHMKLRNLAAPSTAYQTGLLAPYYRPVEGVGGTPGRHPSQLYPPMGDGPVYTQMPARYFPPSHAPGPFRPAGTPNSEAPSQPDRPLGWITPTGMPAYYFRQPPHFGAWPNNARISNCDARGNRGEGSGGCGLSAPWPEPVRQSTQMTTTGLPMARLGVRRDGGERPYWAEDATAFEDTQFGLGPRAAALHREPDRFNIENEHWNREKEDWNGMRISYEAPMNEQDKADKAGKAGINNLVKGFESIFERSDSEGQSDKVDEPVDKPVDKPVDEPVDEPDTVVESEVDEPGRTSSRQPSH